MDGNTAILQTAPAVAALSIDDLLAAGVARLPTLAGRNPSFDFVEKIPIAFARRHRLIGLAAEDHTAAMPVVFADVEGWSQIDIVGRFLNRPIEPFLAPAADVATAINTAYQQRTGQAQTLVDDLGAAAGDLDRDRLLAEVSRLGEREDLLDVAARAPVIKLVNLMLFEAVQARASDVHVQPFEESLVIRLRVDGVLYDTFTLPTSLQEEVVSRIKVMGRMNIAEKRLPQDGRATAQVGDRAIDLRIASLPSSFGERVVIRLLDKSVRLYDLPELGMEPGTMQRFRRLVSAEHGLILVSGPTGSGKTTTLYAALKELDSGKLNVLTLEDPIEYRLPGISQTQVSEKKGMTFASGLRSVLRQDPDVIMVGEIRDRETAAMAIQSALTGHLVFSTLHTNDAASSITRLLDLGVEPYLLASSIIGVLAQRLVRRVCDKCGQQIEPSPEDCREMGVASVPADTHFRRGAGCPACRSTGYSGRVGIFELLEATEGVRRLINARSTANEIKTTAESAGMRTLRADGLSKAGKGMTTIEEVERVTTRLAD